MSCNNLKSVNQRVVRNCIFFNKICIKHEIGGIICCQIFCDLLLKSAFEWIFIVMQLILVKIKCHIK